MQTLMMIDNVSNFVNSWTMRKFLLYSQIFRWYLFREVFAKEREKKCEIINCDIIKLLILSSHEAEIFLPNLLCIYKLQHDCRKFSLLESLDNGHVESKGTQTLAE